MSVKKVATNQPDFFQFSEENLNKATQIIKKYPENELSIESNQIQTKVLDSNHNLVAIGYVMCENNVWLFKPTKVFI